MIQNIGPVGPVSNDAPRKESLPELLALLDKQIAEVDRLLKTPDMAARPFILVDRDVYLKEHADIAKKNFEAGISRGEKNLIFYLSQVSKGELSPGDFQVKGLDDFTKDSLRKLILKLVPETGE